MKVYCNDCKHLVDGVMGGLFCSAIYKSGSDEFGEYKRLTMPHANNSNNNCIEYERTWYKFWIPKDKGFADGKLSIAETNESGGLSII